MVDLQDGEWDPRDGKFESSPAVETREEQALPLQRCTGDYSVCFFKNGKLLAFAVQPHPVFTLVGFLSSEANNLLAHTCTEGDMALQSLCSFSSTRYDDSLT